MLEVFIDLISVTADEIGSIREAHFGPWYMGKDHITLIGTTFSGKPFSLEFAVENEETVHADS